MTFGMRGAEGPDYGEDYADHYNNRSMAKGPDAANSKASPRSSMNAQVKGKKKSNALNQQYEMQEVKECRRMMKERNDAPAPQM